MVMASLTWKHPKKGFRTSKKKGYSLKSTTTHSRVLRDSHLGSQHWWSCAITSGEATINGSRSGSCGQLGFLHRQRTMMNYISTPLDCANTWDFQPGKGNNDEQCLHTSGLCKHPGFLNSQGTMLSNISTPLDCGNTWGFRTGKENNDERLNTSGSCEHLGFLNSQENNAGVH